MKKIWKKSLAVMLMTTMLTTQMTVPAYAGLKDKLSEIGNTASDLADKAKEKATDTVDKVKESDVAKKASDAAESAKEKVSDTATKVKESDVVNAAKEKAESVGEKAGDVKDTIITAIHNIDPKQFSEGWEFVKKLGAAEMAAKYLKDMNVAEYLGNVRGSIDTLKDSMNSYKGTRLTKESLAGFVAEEWHAGTFNIDAAIKETGDLATVEKSNGFGSVDVSTNDGGTFGMKYYKNGKESAKAQGTSTMERYMEYCSHLRDAGKEEPTLEEYMNEMSNISDLSEIYDSIYKGQTRIIPSDQMDDAVAYLQKRIDKNAAKGTEKNLKISKSAQETLDSLSDVMKSEKGTTSKALTSEQSKAIAELCRDGKFKPEDFGLKMSDLIPAKYVFKQAIGAGTSAAVLSAVLEMGPQLYTAIVKSLEEGEIDEEAFKKMGIDGAIAGTEGFVEGSVSSILLMACKSGSFGTAFNGASPDAVGAVTVLLIDAVKYGYDLANGDITIEEYGKNLTEEAFVAAVSQGSGVALQAMLPMVPFAYLAGSLVGGMLASSGYEIGKEVVLEMRGGAGLEAIMPAQVAEGVEIGKDVIADLKVKDKVSAFKDMAVSTTEKGLIQIKGNA